jgi:hypothetical protein
MQGMDCPRIIYGAQKMIRIEQFRLELLIDGFLRADKISFRFGQQIILEKNYGC